MDFPQRQLLERRAPLDLVPEGVCLEGTQVSGRAREVREVREKREGGLTGESCV